MNIQRPSRFRRALMLMSLSAYLALGFYLAVTRGLFAHDSRSTVAAPQQLPAVEIQELSEEDINRHLKIVPPTFTHIDFKNHAYGPYRLPSGKTIDLVLNKGGHQYDYFSRERGWFDLDEVYYADLTGDGDPEAIVVLSHIQCGGGSCDGGAALFYIYAARNGELQRIWKYETGSYGYGCGLKSFSAQDKQIELEVFGRCPQPARDYQGSAKFVVDDLTQLEFRFNGKRFVRTKMEFVSASATDVKNYDAEIRIN